MPSVAIVGGGSTGLAAAYHLERSASLDRLALFETADRLGGVIRTEERDGFVLDVGPDSILAEPPAALELCRELGLEGDLIGPRPHARSMWIYSRGRLRPVPLGVGFGFASNPLLFVRSGLLSVPGLLRVALEPLVREPPDSRDESLAEFFGRRLGREAVERLVDPLLSGIYAGDVARLSVRATFPRFPALVREHGSLLRGLRAGRAANPRDDGGRPGFFGLAGGLERLVDALERSLKRTENHVRTGVGAVRRADSVRYEIFDLQGKSLGRFDGVVLAIPSHHAAEVLRPVDAELASSLARILYVSTASVFLAYDHHDLARVPQGQGFFVPSAERRVLRGATFVSHKYDGRAPPGSLLVRGYIGGWGREDAVEREDADLLETTQAELEEIAGLRARPRFGCVFRFHRATPQYEVGHLDRVTRIEALLAKHPGIVVAGNAYRGMGIPACVADGRRAATHLLTTVTGAGARAER